MVQFQMISQNTSATMERVLAERAAALRKRVVEKMADRIIEYSPVDTGTYVLAHTVRPEETNYDTRSSHGRARARNPAQFKALARGNLMRSVSALSLDAREVWFRNRAVHAPRVEYLGWPGRGAYHVYARVRAEGAQMIRDAAQELGFT